MPLKPEDIESKQFTVALRGYDKDEVSLFLRVVAADYRALRESKGAGSGDDYEGVGREISGVLKSAKEAAERICHDAEAEAAAIRRRSEEEAGALRAATREEAERIRREAERDAALLRGDAEKEAVALRGSADRAESLKDAESKVRQRLLAIEQMLRQITQSDESTNVFEGRNEPPPPVPVQGKPGEIRHPASGRRT